MSRNVSKDIVISLDGVPGPALGCFMVDRNLELLWYRAFSSRDGRCADNFRYCYHAFGGNEPCQPCAAWTAFSTGRPASCKQEVTLSGGEKRTYHIVSSPVRSDDGAVTGCVEVIHDVTSRNGGEESYKEISEFNYNIIYNAPVAIFTLNREGIITSTNPAHLKIAGNPPLEEVLGLDWLHSPMVIAAGLDRYLEKGLAGENFEVSDLPFTTQLTGRRLYMTLRGVPLRNKNLEIEGLLCILEDTTGKNLYLKEMERLQKFNENIIQSITNGIMVVNSDSKICTWNAGMTEIFRISRAHAFSMPLEACLRRMGLSDAVFHIRKGISDGITATLEKVSVETPARGFITLNYKVIPLFTDKAPRPGVVLFFEDVTQKEKTEIRYRTLFKSARDGIVVTDTEGRFLSANPMALGLWNVEWRELKEGRIQDMIRPEDRERFLERLRSIREGREVRSFRAQLCAVEGQDPLPVEMSVSRVLEHEKTVALQFIMRDIRERLRLEAELLQAGKLSGLGELAAGVAHEINNPLATVAGYAEEIMDLLEEWKDRMKADRLLELKSLARTIRDQSYRCKEITRSLLDFARIHPSALVEVDLNEVVRSVLAMAGYPEGGDGDRVFLDLEEPLPPVRADHSHIQQVILNIFKNALDATERGGRITLETGADAHFVWVVIRDTGIGMSEVEVARIFDPFFTTKPPDRGTGLGLSICYRIVERLGGRIDATTREGEGSTFRVFLPRKEKNGGIPG